MRELEYNYEEKIAFTHVFQLINEEIMIELD